MQHMTRVIEGTPQPQKMRKTKHTRGQQAGGPQKEEERKKKTEKRAAGVLSALALVTWCGNLAGIQELSGQFVVLECDQVGFALYCHIF